MLLFTFHWNGMMARSCGFQHSHSQRFHPVLRSVQGGFERRVLSMGAVQARASWLPLAMQAGFAL
jgi:hypothetical protein